MFKKPLASAAGTKAGSQQEVEEERQAGIFLKSLQKSQPDLMQSLEEALALALASEVRPAPAPTSSDEETLEAVRGVIGQIVSTLDEELRKEALLALKTSVSEASLDAPASKATLDALTKLAHSTQLQVGSDDELEMDPGSVTRPQPRQPQKQDGVSSAASAPAANSDQSALIGAIGSAFNAVTRSAKAPSKAPSKSPGAHQDLTDGSLDSISAIAAGGMGLQS